MKTRELVVMELEKNGQMTAAAISHQTGRSSGGLFRTLERMVRDGEVVRVDEPRKWVYYRLPRRA